MFVCSRDVPHRCYKVLQITERSFKMGENYRENFTMGEGMGGKLGKAKRGTSALGGDGDSWTVCQ